MHTSCMFENIKNINNAACSILGRRKSMGQGTQADSVHYTSEVKTPGVTVAWNLY